MDYPPLVGWSLFGFCVPRGENYLLVSNYTATFVCWSYGPQFGCDPHSSSIRAAQIKTLYGGIIKFTRGSYLFLFITTRERDIKIKGAKKYPSIGKSKSVWITINLFAQSKCNYFQFWSNTLDFISSTMKMFLQKKKSSSVHSINKLMHIRNIIWPSQDSCAWASSQPYHYQGSRQPQGNRRQLNKHTRMRQTLMVLNLNSTMT